MAYEPYQHQAHGARAVFPRGGCRRVCTQTSGNRIACRRVRGGFPGTDAAGHQRVRLPAATEIPASPRNAQRTGLRPVRAESRWPIAQLPDLRVAFSSHGILISPLRRARTSQRLKRDIPRPHGGRAGAGAFPGAGTDVDGDRRTRDRLGGRRKTFCLGIDRPGQSDTDAVRTRPVPELRLRPPRIAGTMSGVWKISLS